MLVRPSIAIFSVTLATSLNASTVAPQSIVETYSDIAYLSYTDALATAKHLQLKIEEFILEPSEIHLQDARAAWVSARVPYQQTEAFRFANPLVDEWEGKVNAWPLDEGLIDYVDNQYLSAENPLGASNVIATTTLQMGAESLDLSKITPAVVSSLHEVGGIETNVAAGYHAIEFLLWGQDLNSHAVGAGNRPYTDYLADEGCTNGNCDRRADYLRSAASLLVSDLEEIVAAWSASGEARADISNDASALQRIIFGLGSLAYGELAGERMKLGLLVNDPEEEHDCFSDNTHNSHFYDVLGMHNVYYGDYSGLSQRVSGPSLAALVRQKDSAVADSIDLQFAKTMTAFTQVKTAAEAGEAYDSMLAANNPLGNAVLQRAIDELVQLAGEFEKASATLELNTQDFEGSDSLDNTDAVI